MLFRISYLFFKSTIPASWGIPQATVVQEEPAKDPKGKDGSGSRRKRPHVESSDSEESSSNDDDNDQKQRPRVYGSLYTGDHEWGRPILPLRRAWIRSKEWTSSRTRRIKVKEKELEDRRLSQCTKRIYATSLVDWEVKTMTKKFTWHLFLLDINIPTSPWCLFQFLLALGVLR